MNGKRVCYYRACEAGSCTDCSDFTSDPDLKTITITTEEFEILSSLYDSDRKNFTSSDTVKETIEAIKMDNYHELKGA